MALTLKRTAMYLSAESGNPGYIFRVLLHEGLLYYRCVGIHKSYDLHLLSKALENSVIFAVTLTFTLMIVFADPSVKNITGQYVYTRFSCTFSCMSSNRRCLTLSDSSSGTYLPVINIISPDTYMYPHQSQRGDDVTHHSPP
jgi:hypothetical protein